MPFINHATKTIAIKIVYYGPGLSGKTTNLRYIYHKLDSAYRGELVCLETETDRTYFFDLLPIRAGMIGEFKVHFQLMSVPRPGVLRGLAQERPARRGRHRLRRRLPDPAPRRQPRELRRPAPQLPPARHRPDEDPARLPVQQARPRLPHPGRDVQQPPQSAPGALGRGRGRQRRRRLRDAPRDLQADRAHRPGPALRRPAPSGARRRAASCRGRPTACAAGAADGDRRAGREHDPDPGSSPARRSRTSSRVCPGNTPTNSLPR
ncbi:MAG: hypothetical protein MZV70_37975 [Desulfobacterales bacterium]|nr:hypothetical protein [Desulfobacterales bacterium]